VAAEPAEQELDVFGGLAAAEAAISPGATRELESIGEISFLSQELRKRLGLPAHAVLGVPADAERPAVQAAHRRIAKILEPDRIPEGCDPELAREAQEVLRAVTVAAEEMERDLRRKGAPAPPPPAASARVSQPATGEEQARRFFLQGRDWVAKRNYWQAADALRQAVRLKSGDALYRQYLGLALMQTKRLHEAEEHLVEATRIEPNNPSHFVNLGRIYRAGRLYKKAREAFDRALRLDPRNQHAREELSDLPEEAPPGRKAEGGLLKKLFGK
jgi:tetratricopeptide (TPR) repeat protein